MARTQMNKYKGLSCRQISLAQMRGGIRALTVRVDVCGISIILGRDSLLSVALELNVWRTGMGNASGAAIYNIFSVCCSRYPYPTRLICSVLACIGFS